jgi:hypothetical protein
VKLRLTQPAPAGSWWPTLLIALLLVASYVGGAKIGLPTIPGLPWIVTGPPSPIAEPGFRVAVVEETKLRGTLPSGQLDIITATNPGSVRAYVDAKGAEKFQLIDPNSPTDKLAPHWQAALKRERKSVPWMIAGNGRTGFEGPLPESREAAMKILKPLGGE